MIVRVDNIGAMFLANNAVLSQRTKHTSIRQRIIREHVGNGIIKIILMKSKLNTADIFTKNLSQELFKKHPTNLLDRKYDAEDQIDRAHEK